MMHVTGIAIAHGILALLLLGALFLGLAGTYAVTRRGAFSRPERARKLGSLSGMLGTVIVILFTIAEEVDELMIELGVLTRTMQASFLRFTMPLIIAAAAVLFVLICASIVLIVWADVVIPNRPPRSSNGKG